MRDAWLSRDPLADSKNYLYRIVGTNGLIPRHRLQ